MRLGLKYKAYSSPDSIPSLLDLCAGLFLESSDLGMTEIQSKEYYQSETNSNIETIDKIF